MSELSFTDIMNAYEASIKYVKQLPEVLMKYNYPNITASDWNNVLQAIDNCYTTTSNFVEMLSAKLESVHTTLTNAIGSLDSNKQDKEDETLQTTSKVVVDAINELNSGKQAKITNAVPLSSDLVDDTNAAHLFVSASEKVEWSGKQDVLTFDSTPTENSDNPVTSGGIKSALDSKANTADVYTKTEIDNKVSAVFKYKGTVSTISALDEIVNPNVGDVYHINGTNEEYVCVRISPTVLWEYLGVAVDISGKQDKTDNNLTTTAKTVVGAINELNTELSGKQDALTFDDAPTASSTNPVTSGGVYSAIQENTMPRIFNQTLYLGKKYSGNVKKGDLIPNIQTPAQDWSINSLTLGDETALINYAHITKQLPAIEKFQLTKNTSFSATLNLSVSGTFASGAYLIVTLRLFYRSSYSGEGKSLAIQSYGRITESGDYFIPFSSNCFALADDEVLEITSANDLYYNVYVGSYNALVTAPVITLHSQANYTENNTTVTHYSTFRLFDDMGVSAWSGKGYGAVIFNSTENAASGDFSSASGKSTKAEGKYQCVAGKYNIPDETSARITGWGTSENDRKNIEEFSRTGDLWVAGDIYVGATNNRKILATKEYVDSLVGDIEAALIALRGGSV